MFKASVATLLAMGLCFSLPMPPAQAKTKAKPNANKEPAKRPTAKKAPAKRAQPTKDTKKKLDQLGAPPYLALPVPGKKKPKPKKASKVLHATKRAIEERPQVRFKKAASKRQPPKRPAVARKPAKRTKPAVARKPAKRTKPAAAKTPVRRLKPVRDAIPAKRPVVRKVAPRITKRVPPKRPVVRKVVKRAKAVPPRRRPTSRPAIAKARKTPPVPRWKPLPKRIAPVDPNAVMYLQPGTKTSQLGVVGQSNWFGIRVSETGWYVLQTKGRADTHCSLLDKSFRQLAHNDDSGERRNCRVIRHFQPGNYLFKVMLLPGKRTQYSLSYHQIQSKTLTLGQSEKGRLTWPGDLHFYQFKVKKAGLYTIATTGRADTVCQLLATMRRDAFPMARDDDSGPKRNCALTWQFRPGKYTLMVTGSYIGRGPYRIKLQRAKKPGLKFKVMSFGKMLRDLLMANQAHLFRFQLTKASRVTFMAALRRTTPQMYIRGNNGKIVTSTAEVAKMRGRFWLYSQWLPAGEYALELRAAGKPRGLYMLIGHIENDVLLPANKARPMLNGLSSTPAKTPFRHGLFRVALDGRYYNVLEAKSKGKRRMLACFLESIDGRQLVIDYIPNRKPRPCRIATTGRSGVFLFRALFVSASYKPRKRISLRERRMRRRRSFRDLLRRMRRKRRERYRRRFYNRDFRRLYRRPNRAPARRRPAPNRLAPPPKPMVLPLFNQFKGPQVRLIQSNLGTLRMNQNLTAKVGGAQLFQIDVAKADLYWFSSRGKKIRSCRIDGLFGNKIKQSQLAKKGCDVAVYLQRGSYLFHIEAAPNKTLRASWRPYRSMPKVLGKEPVVVGPVKRGQEHKHQLRIRKDGFYQLTATVASSVPLKTSALLKRGTTIVSRPHSRFHKSKLISYLKKGTYHLHIKVSQGRGAYMLKRSNIPSQNLRLGKTATARLKRYNDVYFFLLNVPRTGNYQFETRGKLDTICTLSSLKNRRLSRNDDSGVGRNCRVIRRLTAGRYAVRVRNLTRKAGAFTASFNKAKASTRLARRARRRRILRRLMRMRRRRLRRYRNASGRTITRRIRIGRSYTGTLRNKRDRHVYIFRVTTSGRYILETKGPSNRTDTKCYLYKGRRMVASNDDSGYRLHCRIKKNLTPGLYKLAVRLALSSRAGPYRLNIRRFGRAWPGVAIARRGKRRVRRRVRRRPRIARPRRRVRRPRNWLSRMARRPKTNRPTPAARATSQIALRPGLRTQAMVVRQDRTDIYTVKIPIAGTYIIRTDGNLDTKCYLDDARGGVIGVNDDSGDAANCQLQLRLPYGAYQLRVSIRTAGRIGPYGVRVTLKR